MNKQSAEDIANKIKAQQWNECITPRLEPMRAWFSGPEWEKGLGPYLNGMKDRFIDVLVRGDSNLTFEQVRFITGQIAAIKELLAFPSAIENAIAIADRNRAESEKREKSVGKAGY